jgi:BlaI family transcriptional regulator, penicillinase repressor
MARPTSSVLTDGELRLMKVIWDRGPSTVTEVRDALSTDTDVTLAPSTLRTLLGILEEKGYLRSEPRGKAKVYTAVVDRAMARGNVARYVIDRFFNGSARELVLGILKDEEIDEKELKRLRRLITEGE